MSSDIQVLADESAAVKNTPSLSGVDFKNTNPFVAYSNPIKAEKKRLESGVILSLSQGRKAAISMSKYLQEIYKNREELLKDNPRHLKSFAQYQIDTFEMPSSTAYSNLKVVEMLSKHKHDVLTKFADLIDLIKLVRMIADSPRQAHEELLEKLESFDRDTLAEAIVKARTKYNKKAKPNSQVIKKTANWDDAVATSFNPIKGLLKLEYTGESKDDVKEYFELIQKLVLEKDKDEVMVFLSGEVLEEETSTDVESGDMDSDEETTIDGVPISQAPQLI
jgi:hypothetical protein